ncbi:MAG: type I restriction enzyme HsdR N-terminal domain-containing protein [Desulfobacterales bacterium]
MVSASAPDTLVDYLSGRPIPDVGAEKNRQAVIRYLIDTAGYERGDISAGVPITLTIGPAQYRSTVDLVVTLDEAPLMVVKCAAGSLGSREREALAAARLLYKRPVPLSAVTDGESATLLASASGRKIISADLSVLPTRPRLRAMAETYPTQPLSETQRHRESLIFRSYDSMNINVARGHA